MEDSPRDTALPTLILGPLLRRGNSPQSISVWVETSRACQVTVLAHSCPTFRIAGRHYAIVDLPDQPPGSKFSYTVRLDEQLVWPDPSLAIAPVQLEVWDGEGDLRISGGSCRQQAPQHTRGDRHSSEPTATDELGADALAALATEIQRGERQMPHLLLLTGDQVYADERHESVTSHLRTRRGGGPQPGYPEVTSFDEYAWLYQRTWSHPRIRWLLASVPSVMIFDDHDVIDDWNISDTWAANIAENPWWQDRLDAALMSYWVYQHLGNLSTVERSTNDLFQRVQAADDGAAELRAHARMVGTGVNRYDWSWSYNFDLGRVNVVVLDARNGRVLEPEKRSMLSPRDWAFLDDAIAQNPDVLVVSSVPWLLPPGVHHLERFISQLVAGKWGRRIARLGERIRREIDLEHWAAFGRSVEELTERLRQLSRTGPKYPPIVFSGDVHFAYVAEQPLDNGNSAYQIVSSPLRQGDAAYEQVARWAAMTATFDKVMRRFAGRSFRSETPQVRHRLVSDVWTHNNIASVTYRSDDVHVAIDRAELTAEGLRLSSLVSTWLADSYSPKRHQRDIKRRIRGIFRGRSG